MAVYDEPKGKKRIAFYTSPDLKTWTYQSAIDDFFECPDLFELDVAGEPDLRKWVLYGADGKYLIGRFDGKAFTKESGKHQVWYGNFYAAQTFDNAPEGRRVQVGWAQGVTFPGMPFNQQMTVPVELGLRKTADGVRMFANPVPEVNHLVGFGEGKADVRLGAEPTILVHGLDAAMVHLEFAAPKDGAVRFQVRGLDLVYDSPKGMLRCGKVAAPLKPDNGKVLLRVLIDRGSVEVFANAGAVAMSVAHVAPEKDTALTAAGDGVTLDRVTWLPMRSAWR
jgi:fructan beta-fructosidase